MPEALIAGRHDPTPLADLAEGHLRSKCNRLEQALTGVVQEHHRFIIGDQIEAYLARLSILPAADTPTDASATPAADLTWQAGPTSWPRPAST
jgi:hypothetical protein